MEYNFNAVLVNAGGGGVYVAFPYDVKKEFGKSRVPFVCTIDGEPYRGTLVKHGTPHHIIIVLKEIREKINKKPGDKVKVWLVEDFTERTVDLPDDFKKILIDHKLIERFSKMIYSHRKEWMQWINSAKKQETRLRRMESTISQLISKN